MEKRASEGPPNQEGIETPKELNNKVKIPFGSANHLRG